MMHQLFLIMHKECVSKKGTRLFCLKQIMFSLNNLTRIINLIKTHNVSKIHEI